MFITTDPIDPTRFLVTPPAVSCGGSAIFTGRVRNHHEGKAVHSLHYECYIPMAEKQIGAILQEVREKTGAAEIRAIHRIGLLKIGDIAVVISADAAHRQEAFEACRLTLEKIKSEIPIWKKEFYEDRSQSWVFCRHHE